MRSASAFARAGMRVMEGEGHAVPIGRAQVLGPLAVRASVAASNAAEMTAPSTSRACCQPSRGYRRRACGHAVPRRGYRRARRGRRAAARPRRARVFPRAGMSSPAASRLKMVSIEASRGSAPARPSAMEPRACVSGSVRLIVITSKVGGMSSAGAGCMSLVKTVLGG